MGIFVSKDHKYTEERDNCFGLETMYSTLHQGKIDKNDCGKNLQGTNIVTLVLTCFRLMKGDVALFPLKNSRVFALNSVCLRSYPFIYYSIPGVVHFTFLK